MINIYELTVAAILENEGYTVCYEDFVTTRRSTDMFGRFLAQDTSDMYIIWSVNLSIKNDVAASEQIRRHAPAAYIVYAGPAPTYYARHFLQDDRQIAVRGEPEETVGELCRLIVGKQSWREVRGISFLDGRQAEVRHNPPRALLKELDSLPFPARHLVDRRLFSNPKLKRSPYTAMVTSRNCPFHCIYCVPSSLTFARELEYRAGTGKKPPVSMRSPENVVAEIDLLAAEGYRAIGFMDDNFITSEKRLAPIAAALRRHGIAWGCQARADAITADIARILGESGCGYVDLGVESFDDEILKYIRKGLTHRQIVDAIGHLNRCRVPVKLNILIGTSPLETEASVRETLDTAIRLHASQVMINIAAPFPGTEFHRLAMENHWIEGGEYVPTDVQHHSILSYPGLSGRKMEKLLFRYNLRFFLRPGFIWSHIRRFSSFSEFWKACRALKNKLTRSGR
jgi:radical SAM superfamily enzyme YgiQ (UPF0313 family)